MGFLVAMIVLLVVTIFGVWSVACVAATGLAWFWIALFWLYPIIFTAEKVVKPFIAGNKGTAIIYGIGLILAVVVVLVITFKFHGTWGLVMMVICELLAYRLT